MNEAGITSAPTQSATGDHKVIIWTGLWSLLYDVAYSQVWWPILGIRALHLPIQVHTHSSEHTHTHTMNTHPEQWAAIYAVVPGEQLGTRCLIEVLKVERALYIRSPHLQSLPDQDSNSQPFNYESESLTIRPRLLLHECFLFMKYAWIYFTLLTGWTAKIYIYWIVLNFPFTWQG